MGGIENWEGAAGTLIGMLLRGYATGLSEEERRKQLEQSAKAQGVQLPPIEPSGYLGRVLRSPKDVMRPYAQQESVLAALYKQKQEKELELYQQGLLMAREQALAGTRQTGSEALERMRSVNSRALQTQEDRAAMARAQYNKTTPGAMRPEELAALRARAGRNTAETRWLDTMIRQFESESGGKSGPMLAPPAPNAPALSAPATPLSGDSPVSGKPALGGSNRNIIEALRKGGLSAGEYQTAPGEWSLGMRGPSVTYKQELTPEAAAGREALKTEATTKARITTEQQLKGMPTNIIVATLRGLSQKINTQSDPLKATIRGTKSRIGNMTRGVVPGLPYSKDVSSFEAVAESYRSALVRSRAMEVGALAEGDIRRATQMVSSIYSTKEEAEFKYDLLDELGAVVDNPDISPGEIAQRVQIILRELENATPSGLSNEELNQRYPQQK